MILAKKAVLDTRKLDANWLEGDKMISRNVTGILLATYVVALLGGVPARADQAHPSPRPTLVPAPPPPPVTHPDQARRQGYQDGLPDGTREGNERGPGEGQRDGLHIGHDAGFAQCEKEARQRAYDGGYHDGFVSGEGETGIYVTTPEQAKEEVEVYWISPKVASKQEAAGLLWFESEVIYAWMDLKQEGKVQALDLIRCKDGTVLLDLQSKRWEIGCPAGPVKYHMVRLPE